MIKLLHKEIRKLRRVLTHPTFLFLSITGNAVLLAATAAVYYFEVGINPHVRSYFEVLWWGVSTITTVGFGDIVPVTTAGRAIGILLMYTGTVLFISFTGVLVSVWTEAEVEKDFKPIDARIERLLQDIRQRLDRLEDR